MPRKSDSGGRKSDISKKTVKELKEELSKRSLSTSGLKADLVARLEEAIESDQKKTTESSQESSQQEAKNNGESQTQTQEQTKETETKMEEVVPEKPAETKKETPKEEAKKEAPAKVPETTQEQAESMEVDKKKEESKRKEPETPAEETKATDDQSQGKRRKWGSGASSGHSVSTDSLKDILDAETKKDAPTPSTPTSTNVSKPVIQAVKRQTDKPAEEPAVREVPPAKNPQSRILYVQNFVRPFTVKNAEELLKQTGNILAWTMDSIRSQCYVIYETVEEAVRTREALHNLVWPPSSTKKLHAEFATEYEAKVFYIKNKVPVPKELISATGSSPSVAPRPNLVVAALKAATASTPPKPPAASPRQERTEIAKKPAPKPEPVPPPKSLNELFFKTTAKPPIYYLPLSDDEVAKKKEANNPSDK